MRMICTVQHSEERVKTDEACLFLKEIQKHKKRVSVKMTSALDLNNPKVMEEVLKQVTNRTTMSMLLHQEFVKITLT